MQQQLASRVFRIVSAKVDKHQALRQPIKSIAGPAKESVLLVQGVVHHFDPK
jgi:hypothetical protein